MSETAGKGGRGHAARHVPSTRLAANAAPPWIAVAGWFLILLIIALLVWQRIVTGGYIGGRHDWVLLCIGVALVTGLVFWLLTPGAEGELNLPKIGVRLAGGAGIGACFMVLAWWLTAAKAASVVVPLDESSRAYDPVLYEFDQDDLDLAYLLRPYHRLLVEFKDGKERGWFSTRHLQEGGKFIVLKYVVTRAGLAEAQPQRIEEK